VVQKSIEEKTAEKKQLRLLYKENIILKIFYQKHGDYIEVVYSCWEG
jgi:hypothetical protein